MYGSYIVNIDNKFRFYLPKAFRKTMGVSNFILTMMDKDNLIICDASKWSPQNLVEMLKKSLSSDEIKSLENYIKINSVNVSLDREGRIQIPSMFVRRLNFNGSAAVLGEGGYVSVISKELYDFYISELEVNVNNMISEGRLSFVDKSRL